jgi:hypothetical protein
VSVALDGLDIDVTVDRVPVGILHADLLG